MTPEEFAERVSDVVPPPAPGYWDRIDASIASAAADQTPNGAHDDTPKNDPAETDPDNVLEFTVARERSSRPRLLSPRNLSAAASIVVLVAGLAVFANTRSDRKTGVSETPSTDLPAPPPVSAPATEPTVPTTTTPPPTTPATTVPPGPLQATNPPEPGDPGAVTWALAANDDTAPECWITSDDSDQIPVKLFPSGPPGSFCVTPTTDDLTSSYNVELGSTAQFGGLCYTSDPTLGEWERVESGDIPDNAFCIVPQ